MPYTNEEWLEALSDSPNPEAVETLLDILTRGLRGMLNKRLGARAQGMAQDRAQDALLKILDKLDTFRGESKFTTWAQKIAIREALTELRRKRWDDLSIEDLRPDHDPGDYVPPALSDIEDDPESTASRSLLIETLHEIIQDNLSERQRTALMAVMIRGVPLQIVAERMNTNRNAMYKLLYDGRQKIKEEFERRGISAQEVLEHL